MKFVLQILRTIPFDRVNIKVITIHLNGYYDSDYQMYDGEFATRLIELTTEFLKLKSYHLKKVIDQNYIFVLDEGKNKISKLSVSANKSGEQGTPGI